MLSLRIWICGVFHPITFAINHHHDRHANLASCQHDLAIPDSLFHVSHAYHLAIDAGPVFSFVLVVLLEPFPLEDLIAISSSLASV